MQKKLAAKPSVALVTGAARRIGAEIARALHADGFNVIVHYYQSKAAAERLAAKLNGIRPDSAVTIAANLSHTAGLKKFIAQAAKPWGQLDVLVNNAARFQPMKMSAVNEAVWDEQMTINLKTPFFLAAAAAPFLAKRRGCIINIADIHGERPMPGYSAYCISKAGLLMLTRALAKEWGPDIRVNAVSPGGGVALPEGVNTMNAATRKKILARTPLARFGTAAEIAGAVVFLARQADFITGQVLVVDGGRTLML
jgi:pteridine reductase